MPTSAVVVADEFLPTADRIQSGDVLTMLDGEVFPEGALVASAVRMPKAAGVRLVLSDGRSVTVPVGAPVDLLPPF